MTDLKTGSILFSKVNFEKMILYYLSRSYTSILKSSTIALTEINVELYVIILSTEYCKLNHCNYTFPSSNKILKFVCLIETIQILWRFWPSTLFCNLSKISCLRPLIDWYSKRGITFLAGKLKLKIVNLCNAINLAK